MTDPLLVACPHCHGMNRVPAARLGAQPRCGHCHRPLFTGLPVELDAVRFAVHVERSGLPVVVDFWASWCGPCRMMAPHFAQAAASLEPAVRLAKVDTEAESALAGRQAIRSLPTLVLFRGGRELARQTGAMDAAGIVRWTRGQLAAAG